MFWSLGRTRGPLLELFAGFSLESLLFTIALAAMTTVIAMAEFTRSFVVEY